MTLLWPPFLLLILVVPALVIAYLAALRRRQPMGLRFLGVAPLREAGPARSRWRPPPPFALFPAAGALLVGGGARPPVPVAGPSNQTTIILSNDVSGSMCSGDIAPNRLVAAEAAAASF